MERVLPRPDHSIHSRVSPSTAQHLVSLAGVAFVPIDLLHDEVGVGMRHRGARDREHVPYPARPRSSPASSVDAGRFFFLPNKDRSKTSLPIRAPIGVPGGLRGDTAPILVDQVARVEVVQVRLALSHASVITTSWTYTSCESTSVVEPVVSTMIPLIVLNFSPASTESISAYFNVYPLPCSFLLLAAPAERGTPDSCRFYQSAHPLRIARPAEALRPSRLAIP